jgi:hypothetical protein
LRKQDGQQVVVFWQADFLGLYRAESCVHRLRRILAKNSDWASLYTRLINCGEFDLDRDWIFNPSTRHRYRAGSFPLPQWVSGVPGPDTFQRIRVTWSHPIGAQSDVPSGLLTASVLDACAKYPGSARSCETSGAIQLGFDHSAAALFPAIEPGNNQEPPRAASASRHRRNPRVRMRQTLPTESENMNALLRSYLQDANHVGLSWSEICNVLVPDAAVVPSLGNLMLNAWAQSACKLCGEQISSWSSIDSLPSNGVLRALEALRRVIPEVRFADQLFVLKGQFQCGEFRSFDLLSPLLTKGDFQEPGYVCFFLEVLPGEAEVEAVIERVEGGPKFTARVNAGSLLVFPKLPIRIELQCQSNFTFVSVFPVRFGLAVTAFPPSIPTPGIVPLEIDVDPNEAAFDALEEKLRAAFEYGAHAEHAEPAKQTVWPSEQQGPHRQQLKFQSKTMFCQFSTMVLLASLARVVLLNHFRAQRDLEGCQLLLSRGEAAVALRPGYVPCFDLLAKMHQVPRRVAGQILLFWQNGLYGLYSLANVSERLRHIFRSPDKSWLAPLQRFCSQYDFDTFWFGNYSVQKSFRTERLLPQEAVSFLSGLSVSFPRCPSKPRHLPVDWSVHEDDRDDFASAPMRELCRSYPGPAFQTCSPILSQIEQLGFPLTSQLVDTLANLEDDSSEPTVVQGELFAAFWLVNQIFFRFHTQTGRG